MKTQATLMLAAAALLPAAASAQSSVTVYGSIDGGVRYQTNVDAAGNGLLSTTSGNYYANRLGFRGKEDLGNGLNAHFQLESGFNDKTGALDNTNNVLFNRTAAVGLGGAWGSVDLAGSTRSPSGPRNSSIRSITTTPRSRRCRRARARACRRRRRRPACPHRRTRVRASTTTSSTPARSGG